MISSCSMGAQHDQFSQARPMGGARWWLCVACLGFAVGSLGAADVYVAPATSGGSDSNPGTLVAPFASIQRAATAAIAGDSVYIRAGTYREVVTPSNSGTSGSPITYRNYQSEAVTISGADSLGSLSWTREGTTSIYRATIPGGLLNVANQNQVFADGRPLVLARWPNVGADLDLTRPGLSRIVTMSGQSGPANTLYTMTVTDPTLPSLDWTGALMGVSGALTSPWCAAKVIGSSANTLTIQVRPSQDDPGTLPIGETVTGAHDGSRYWLSGVSAALDAAGEWHFNAATRVLRVWLPTGDSPASHLLEVRANRPWAFELTQKSYITISGLGFVATSLRTENFPSGNECNSAVFDPSSPRSRNVILQDLTFRQLYHTDSADVDGGGFNPQDTYRFGAYDSGVILAGTAHTLRRCLIDGSAGHGLVVLGDGHVVEDNVIRNTALLGFENSAITLGDLGLYSKHHSIRFNTLFDSGNYLIRFYAGQACVIHHNDAWSGKNLVTDGGYIYTWGSNGSDGTNRTEVAYNRVHDGYAEGYGAQGIYLDEGGTSNYIVHHNVVWNLNTGIAVNGVGGSNIDFVHNTLASGIAGDTPMRVVKIDATGNAVRNNLVQSMINQDEFGSNTPDPILDKNLIGSTDALQLPAQTAPAFVISSNPLFTNPGVQNYTLQAGSPAVNAGSTTAVAVRVQADGSELTVAASGTYVGAPDIGAYERGQPVWTSGTRVTSLMTTANPTGLTASSSVVSTVVLTWTAPAPLPSGGMLIIERKLGDHFIEVGRVASAATTFTETSLLPGTWSYRVRTTAGGTSNIATVSTLAAGRNASGPIRATSYSALNDVGGAMNIDTVNGIVASPSEGDWLRYDTINFGASGSYVSVTASYATDGISAIEIRLDDPNTGTMLTKMSLAGTGWSGTSSTAPIVATSGSHTVYVKFVIPNGQAFFFPCNLFSLAFNLVAAPVGPATCTAMATSASAITLTWSDTANNETGYRVERSADGLLYAQIADLAAGSTTYGDSGLTPATSYWYRVRAVNAGGYSPWSPVALAVTASGVATAPLITSAAPAGGAVGTAYSHTYTASGTAPITYAVIAGALPNGLTLTTAGVLSGTPTATGTFTGTVTATNSVSTANQAFSIAISAATLSDTYASYFVNRDLGDATNSEFRIWIPGGLTTIRGLIVGIHGYGDNYIRYSTPFIQLPAMRELARKHGFAIVANTFDPQGYNPIGATGDAKVAELFAAIGQGGLAGVTGHPEIDNAPVCIFGFSMGGNFTTRFNKAHPERILGMVCANYFSDENATIPSGSPALNTPALIVVGELDEQTGNSFGEDNTVATNVARYRAARLIGARWALCLDRGVGHTYDDSIERLAAPFFDQVIPLRYPAGANPATGPVTLTTLAENSGWLGNDATTASTMAQIAPWASYAATKNQASWLPNGYVAGMWQASNTRTKNLVIQHELYQPFPPPFKNGETITLTADASALTNVTSVSFYDGDVLLGTDATGPYAYAWNGASAGPHAYYAKAVANGNDVISELGLITVRNINPVVPTQAASGGVDLTTGLAGRWTFDETSGIVALDSTGNNNTGTLTNATHVDGLLGKALCPLAHTDGVGVTVPHAASLVATNQVTLSAWLRLGFPGADMNIISKTTKGSWESGVYYKFYIDYEGQRLVFTPSWGISSTELSVPLSANFAGWHHYLATIYAGELRIYVDGNLLGSQAVTGSTMTGIATDPLVIGTSNNGGHLHGLIDEVRVYTVGLSPVQVRALVGLGLAGAVPTAPLITSAAPAGGTLSTVYSHTYTASGTVPISYSVTAGSLPAGLTLSSAGFISGTPTATGTFTGTVTATNSVSTTTQGFSIVIGAAPTAYAYDDFSGSTVNNGGSGWTGEWTAGLASTTGLSYGGLQTSGAAASVLYYGVGQSTRSITTSLSGTVWFSWIQNATATAGAANQIRFMNNGVVECMIGQHFDAETLKIYSDGNGSVVANTAISTLGTKLLAVSVNLGTGAMSLYVNPTGLGSGSAPTSAASATATLGAMAINQLQTVGDGSAYVVDEMRVGPTWASVSPTTTVTASVVGTKIFYNQSGWDGNNAAAEAADDAAIATDKVTLLPGQTATFANYTSFNKGLNGLMIDIANLPGTPVAGDFVFTIGNTNTPVTWAAASAPTTIAVRAGAGVGGSSRVTLIWANNAIQKTWLQVTVKATATTGLSADHVFYVGNAIGECGNNSLNAQVTASDQLGARANPASLNSALITNVYDYNRDKNVTAADQLIARGNPTAVNALVLITVP